MFRRRRRAPPAPGQIVTVTRAPRCPLLIRLAIIGCGRVVEAAYAPALKQLPDLAEVVALVSPDPARAEAVASVLGAPGVARFATVDAMLAGARVDAAVIAVPHHLHVPIIQAAAAAGIDIISEKPLATTLDEVDQVGDVLRTTGGRFAIMHNYLFDPSRSAALDAIRDGRIGSVFLSRLERLAGTPFQGARRTGVNWRTQRGLSGGGVLIDNAYHDVYLSEAAAMSAATEVYATAARTDPSRDVEDLGVMVLTHGSGATSVIQASWAVDSGAISVDEVHGTSGSIRLSQPPYSLVRAWLLDDMETVEREAADLQRRQQHPVELFDTASRSWRPLLQPAARWGGLTDGISGLLGATFAAWASDKPSPCGWPEARHNMAVLTAAYASAARKQVVSVSEFAAAQTAAVG